MSDEESKILDNSTAVNKKTTIWSTLVASALSYTGTIAQGGFDIIPLFYDK